MIADLFEFIKLKTPSLKSVVDYSLKDYDDEDGAIGEHIIVKCILSVQDTSATTFAFKEEVRTCLVDRDEFRKWKRKEDSIKWLV
jgi:hypothetical protein